jgi:hypothetical protein
VGTTGGGAFHDARQGEGCKCFSDFICSFAGGETGSRSKKEKKRKSKRKIRIKKRIRSRIKIKSRTGGLGS